MRLVMTSLAGAGTALGAPRAALRLQLRSTGRVLRADASAVDLEPKDALLLAYLVLEGPTARARLASLLWPDVEDARALGNLRQRLLRLRRAAGMELVLGRPLARLAAGVEHDLHDGHELLAGVEEHAAAGLAEWLAQQREQRRRTHADRLAAAAAQAEAAGELAAALEHASALVTLDPLSEHAHRRLMRLHYLRGDVAAAMAAYERCRDTLRRELSATPSKETEALRADIGMATPPAVRVPTAPAVPLSVLRPPRLVGRNAEWAALWTACDAGAAAVVLGEAGLGKTRLVGDVARARGNFVVVTARPGDERVVYAAIARLLRQLPRDSLTSLEASVRAELARLLPEFGTASAIASEAERARFFNAVAAAVAAARPVVGGVVVEDLHFADEASVELLRYLTGDGGTAWLFTARPGEFGGHVHALIEALVGARGFRVELTPLSLEQLAELIESLGIDALEPRTMAAALHARTGGNPLFALETIKAWLTQGAADATARLPAVSTLSALIERRIGRLSGAAVRLARCAAVAGQSFSAELAAHVLGVRLLDLADAWAELEHAQVFRDGAFAHDLIHESALASVPPPIAQQLHGEVAQFLAARDGEPVRVARHWHAAGRLADAVPWLLRAAAVARSRGALSEEIELREEAAGIDAETGQTQREFETRSELVSRYERTTRIDAAARNVERMTLLACTPYEAGWALSARANLANKRGDMAGAVEFARQAFDIARRHDHVELACDAANMLAMSLNFLGRFEEALSTVDAAGPYFDHAGEGWRGQSLAVRAATLNNLERRREARAALADALALARRRQEPAEQIVILANTAISYRSSGLLVESIAAAEEAERLQQEVDANPRTGINIQLVLGVNLLDRGVFDQALLRLGRVLELAGEDTPMFRQPALNALAMLWLQLGQPARAQPLQHEALRYTQVAVWLRARAHLQLGLLRQRLGQPARDCFEQALRVAPTRGRPLAFMHARLALAELDGGDAGYASALEVDQQAMIGEYTGMRIVTQAALSRIALADQAPKRAALHAREAIALLAQAEPSETYRGEAWLSAYKALAVVGDTRAGEVLADAVAWIRRAADQVVPPEFRDSFLNRNPANRELLALATRLG